MAKQTVKRTTKKTTTTRKIIGKSANQRRCPVCGKFR